MTRNRVLKALYHSHPAVKRFLAWGLNYATLKLALLQRLRLRRILTNYYADSTDPEVLEVVSYLKDNPVQMIPYEYVKHHQARAIDIAYDEDNGYPYVMVGNDKVYFPKEMSAPGIVAAVRTAYFEQDARSPHRYLTENFKLETEDAGVFIGASDGIFCLSLLHNFNAVYLFEADPVWQKPLELTFRNWLHKVNIVPLYVSGSDSDTSVSLDTFFRKVKANVTYIQADIEGFERSLLDGAKALIQQSESLKISLCTYHKHNDLAEFTELLTCAGMRVAPSRGYLIMWQQVPLEIPYLRRGVIYAEKKTGN